MNSWENFDEASKDGFLLEIAESLVEKERLGKVLSGLGSSFGEEIVDEFTVITDKIDEWNAACALVV